MLTNKIVIVTGGNGLLGTEIIKNLSRQNAVAISVDITNENDIENNKLYCDITNENSVQDTIKSILKKHNRIDGWVNNAYPRTKDWGLKLEDFPYESWRTNIDMHLNGYYLCCKEVLLQMKEQGYGSLVNMGSIYGMLGPDFTVYENTPLNNAVGYSAIKGGIINLSRYLASYFGKYNIRVNCVSPGGIFDNQNPIFVENYEKKVPLKRMGTPDDISPTIAFLLSDGAKYITGQNIAVDGGWSII